MKTSKKAKKVLHDVEGTVLAGVDAAFEWLEPRVEQAAHKITDGMHKAKPALQEQMDKLSPLLDDAQKRADATRERVVRDYVPAASARLSDAASATAGRIHDAQVPDFVEAAVTRVTGDKKAVKKARRAAEDALKAASKELKRSQRRKNSKKGWLIAAAVAAAATAGVAIWRASRPIEDPWKTPAPLSPAKPVQPATPVAPASTQAAPAPTTQPVVTAETTTPADVEAKKDKDNNGDDLPTPKPTKLS